MKNLKNLIAEIEFIRNEIHDRLTASELAKFDEIIDELRKLQKSQDDGNPVDFTYKTLLIIGSVVVRDLVSGAIKKILGNE